MPFAKAPPAQLTAPPAPRATALSAPLDGASGATCEGACGADRRRWLDIGTIVGRETGDAEIRRNTEVTLIGNRSETKDLVASDFSTSSPSVRTYLGHLASIMCRLWFS